MPRIRRQVGSFLDSVQKSAIVKVTDTAPTTAWIDFNIGDVIVDKTASIAYMLIAKPAGVANWKEVSIDIDTDSTLSAAVDTKVPSALACKTYADNLAIAGAPAWSETVSGIGQLSTNVEALAVTNDTTAMTPLKAGQLLASPSAIGGTAPAAGSFTTLSTTGLATIGASATVVTGAVALNLGADAANGAVNLGTAGTRVVTLGNITAATQIILNAGTDGVVVTSTGAGDITLNGGDKIVLDSAGTVDINSSAAAINIGNDDKDFAVNIATDGERALTIGSNNGAASVAVVGGTGGINVGANAIAQSVTVGNATGSSALALLTGTGNMTLEGAVTSTYTLSGTGANTGAMIVGGGTGARTASFNVGAAAKTTVIGSTTTTSTTTLNAGSGSIVHVGPCSHTPDAITATSAGVAASVATVVTLITTNGDSDEDNVTLADGVTGQIKIFAVVVAGNIADSVKITPANMAGGSKITFGADPTGLGCHMVFDGTNWCVTSNNGGTVA